MENTDAGDQPPAAPPGGLRGKRAAVILYSGYPDDPRPRRSTNAMAEAGMEVDLLCIDESGLKPRHEQRAGLNIYRVSMKRDRSSKLAYLWKYTRFIAAAFWFLLKKSIRHRYDVVHVHNMPDVLVFSALVPKLQGARIILDLHDPMPELMMSIYKLGPDSKFVYLLRLLERLSILFADVVLTPNITFKNLFASRGCPPEKIHIIMNSPEPGIFNHDRVKEIPRQNGTFQIMHHGSIVHRHGIDLLVEAVALLRYKIPNLHMVYYGESSPTLETIQQTVQRCGVSDLVEYRGPAEQKLIAEAIHQSHVGIIPNRHSSFTSLNFPTRIFEYLAMHRPVIAPATTGIQDYFSENELILFQPGNVQDLADKILWVYSHPQDAAARTENGRKIYLQNLWLDEKRRFLDILSTS